MTEILPVVIDQLPEQGVDRICTVVNRENTAAKKALKNPGSLGNSTLTICRTFTKSRSHSNSTTSQKQAYNANKFKLHNKSFGIIFGIFAVGLQKRQ